MNRPEDFIGMHFFSPVDKMPLVEIIKGEKTSDETIARAVDVVQQIKKTPIVVNDSRGFYTSRVYGTLLTEAAELLEEGVDPQTIERAATMAGFPAPPLAMLDEVSLTLTQHIRKATEEAAARDGVDLPEQPGTAAIDRMVDEFERKGKAAGAGFYDYPADAKKFLWPGLREHFTKAERVDSARRHPGALPVPDGPRDRRVLRRGRYRVGGRCQHRLDHGHRLPAAVRRCGAVHAGLRTPEGSGHPSDRRGLPGFVARARELAASYGERFEPSAYLVDLAEKGERFPA